MADGERPGPYEPVNQAGMAAQSTASRRRSPSGNVLGQHRRDVSVRAARENLLLVHKPLLSGRAPPVIERTTFRPPLVFPKEIGPLADGLILVQLLHTSL